MPFYQIPSSFHVILKLKTLNILHPVQWRFHQQTIPHTFHQGNKILRTTFGLKGRFQKINDYARALLFSVPQQPNRKRKTLRIPDGSVHEFYESIMSSTMDWNAKKKKSWKANPTEHDLKRWKQWIQILDTAYSANERESRAPWLQKRNSEKSGTTKFKRESTLIHLPGSPTLRNRATLTNYDFETTSNKTVIEPLSFFF